MMHKGIPVLLAAAVVALGSRAMFAQNVPKFGPLNPFYAPSTLPFHAPPFNRIQDSDYQPALEAGMAQQLKELKRIADNSAPPTFQNTFVALEKSGQLLGRVKRVFFAIVSANTDPVLQHLRQ
ncbi:MAG: dipeptidyl carboxypeptidase II, partial [Bryobacteraceae bacterium]